jgi:hypothetical protein
LMIHGLNRFKMRIRIRGEIRFDSTTKIDSDLCRIVQSSAKLKFYFFAMRQAIRSPMADFLIECYFKGFCEGRKTFVSTFRDFKRKVLSATLHYAT